MGEEAQRGMHGERAKHDSVRRKERPSIANPCTFTHINKLTSLANMHKEPNVESSLRRATYKGREHDSAQNADQQLDPVDGKHDALPTTRVDVSAQPQHDSRMHFSTTIVPANDWCAPCRRLRACWGSAGHERAT